MKVKTLFITYEVETSDLIVKREDGKVVITSRKHKSVKVTMSEDELVKLISLLANKESIYGC